MMESPNSPGGKEDPQLMKPGWSAKMIENESYSPGIYYPNNDKRYVDFIQYEFLGFSQWHYV